ncbi:MAG: hypothetical protein ABR600_12290 [Actinomycetota bacterium]
MKRAIGALSVGLALIAAAVPASAGPPIGVLQSRLDEKQAAASSVYLAWVQNSITNRKHFNVFFKSRGSSAKRVNPKSTSAEMGGVDGGTLIYQQINGKTSDIAVYSLGTDHALATPAGINTAAWEWHPSISGPRILFGRGNPRNHHTVRRVLLFDTRTHRTRTLAHTGAGIFSVVPGQVNGHYVVWWKCTPKRCDVFRRDLGSGTTIHVPNPGGKLQYNPSVTRSGVVFYARSGLGCGGGVTIRRFEAGAVATLVTFPKRYDTTRTFAYRDGDKTVLLYDRQQCKSLATDVYKIALP